MLRLIEYETVCVDPYSKNWANHCNQNYLRDSAKSSLLSKDITIVTATDAAPFISQHGNNPPTGFDADLINEIAKLLKINFKYEYLQFTQFISAVENNSNTISISYQTDTIAREAFVNFVDFFRYNSRFIVKSSYTATINGLSDLCGKKVVVLVNSTQQSDVVQQNTICGAINQIIFQAETNITDLIQAVASGSVDVGIFLEQVLAYSASHSHGQLKIVGQPYNFRTSGILCNKGNEALSCSLVNAINYLIKEGTYEQLLEKYSFTYKANGVCPSILNLNGTTCSSTCVPDSSFCQTKLNQTNSTKYY